MRSLTRNIILCFMSLFSTVESTLASQPCPVNGSTYKSFNDESSEYIYALKIDFLPKSADGSAVFTKWIFSIADKKSGELLSEFKMYYGCPNGRGLCSVSPPSRPGTKGGYHSEVLMLERDFAISQGAGAPYAIITPGFEQDNWIFSRSDKKMPDLTFHTKDEITPDLHDHLVWIRTTCGSNAE